jgi:uncharacterized membrane protein
VDAEPGANFVESVGPMQMVSVAFEGNRFRGEILPELERLKRDGIVRIIDMLLVRKDSMGAVMVTTVSDLDWEEAVALGAYFGSLAGLASGGPEGMERGAIVGAAELADGHYFDENDVFRVTQVLPDNMSAALVILEHLWAKPLWDAIDRANGIELGNDWIRPEQVFSDSRLTSGPPPKTLDSGE